MTSPKLASAERRAMLLHAGARVTKNVTSILDPDQLLQQTVNIICDEFGFYYAGVFLIDETGQWAVLRAGRGGAGAAMIAQRHKLAVGGNSMIGAATGLREARIALDVGKEAVFFKNPNLPDTRSEMGLPLTIGDEVIGALTVQSTKESAFTQEDIEALQTMADLLAIAIKNSRLHRSNQDLLRQIERRSRLLGAANQVGQGVASILEIESLLPKMVNIICNTFGFYYAGVFLINDTAEWAVLCAGYGAAGAKMVAAGHKLAIGGNSMIGAATGLREARIALDVGKEAVFFRNPYLPHTRSEMALPLVFGDKILGAVTVQSVEERAFTEDDITSLQTMADHLAIAIHNAQILQELERAHAELLRTKTFEALATATTEAIHWIGNKALPLTATVSRMQDELAEGQVDIESLREDLDLINESADLIVQVKESLIGPVREQMPQPAVVADVVQAAAFYTNMPANKLSIKIAPDAPMVLADTTQLVRALGNLLQNALEACAQHVTVSIKRAKQPGQVLVQVIDDGEGIPEDILDSIWASFFSTKGIGHTGLGLSACLHIMTQLGGHISVESEIGKGATFKLWLPASPGEDLISDVDLASAPENVLIIDDDDEWSQFVIEALTAAGKKPILRPALEGQVDADLILVDEALEAMPIAKVLETLKVAGVVEKALVVTAAIQVERTTAHLNAGVRDVLLKPYTLAGLAAIVLPKG